MAILRALVVVIYIRVSDPKQEAGTSLESQERECRAYAASHGWEVARVYREVYSAKDIFHRRELGRLLDDIRAHSVDVVVVYDPDRLSREPLHAGYVQLTCEQHKVELHFVNRPATGPHAELLEYVIHYAAKLERLQIIERTTRGAKTRLDNGMIMAKGSPPFGYAWNEAKRGYVFDEERAPIARRIFQEIGGGKSLRKLAFELNDEGVPVPRKGRTWQATTLRAIIMNPTYRGQVYRQQTSVENDSRVNVPPEEWRRMPDGIAPAMITQDEYEACLDGLRRNRLNAPRGNKHVGEYLLRGMVKCAGCGHAMHATMGSGGRLFYACRRSPERPCASRAVITAPKLDGEVWERVAAFMANPADALEQVQAEGGIELVRAELESVQGQQKALEKKIARLVSSLADTDNASVGKLITTEIEHLSDQRAFGERRAEALLETIRQHDAVVGRINMVGMLPEYLGELPIDERRKLLEALRVEVTVARTGEGPRWYMRGVVVYSTDVCSVRNVEWVLSAPGEKWKKS